MDNIGNQKKQFPITKIIFIKTSISEVYVTHRFTMNWVDSTKTLFLKETLKVLKTQLMSNVKEKCQKKSVN